MLDPSVVLSKGSGPHRVVLSPALPDVIVDAGSAGASVTFSGTVLSATIDNTFTPGTWAPATSPTAVATGRRAFKQGGPDQAPITVTWS